MESEVVAENEGKKLETEKKNEEKNGRKHNWRMMSEARGKRGSQTEGEKKWLKCTCMRTRKSKSVAKKNKKQKTANEHISNGNNKLFLYKGFWSNTKRERKKSRTAIAIASAALLSHHDIQNY